MRDLMRVFVVCGVLCAPVAMAQDDESADGGWAGAGEFGLVSTSGNTDTTAINLKLEFIKESANWRHRLTGVALYSEKDSVTDNERYTFEGQSDRKLNETSYVFGALRWEVDKFGAYDPQRTLTAGYGRQLVKTENHELKGEIGLGYRSMEERVSGEESNELIARLLLDDSWQVFESTLWTNRLLIESGSDNTFTQFNTDLAVAMNEKLALKFGFEVRNNSDVPAGSTDDTDTKTTVNLVYNF